MRTVDDDDDAVTGGLERSDQPAGLEDIVDEARRYALSAIRSLAKGPGVTQNQRGARGARLPRNATAGLGAVRLLLEIARAVGPDAEELKPRKAGGLGTVGNVTDPALLAAARAELIRRRQEQSRG